MDDWDDLIITHFTSAGEENLARFCMASQDGDIAKMQSMLDNELILNINEQSPKKKETALHYASRTGCLESIKFLVERGADVNVKDVRGKHSLQLASSNGHLECVKYLIAHNASLDVVDKYGRSCLHWASVNRFYGVACHLIEKGAPVTYAISNNWQPLHEAVKGGDIRIAQLLIDNGAPVNPPRLDGKPKPFTPLHIAAREGHTDCLVLLLKNKAMVNAKNQGKQTALHEAAFKGAKDCVHQLIMHGADPHARNDLERSPLLETCNQGFRKCAILLLDAGSFVNRGDRCGDAALHHLLREYGQLTSEELASFTDILLQYGANVYSVGREDETPLMLANKMVERDVIDAMYASLEKPQTLRHLAKIAARKILRCDYENVAKFGIPKSLERYLLQNSRYYSGW